VPGLAVRITDAPLDEGAARAAVSSPKNGGVVVFLGVVRNEHEGRPVTAVEYEAFVPMAERELAAIVAEAARAHDVLDVAVLHRTGRLTVGETSLVVAVGAPHRGPAFRCAEEIITALKARVPIWKKEIGKDGASWQDGVTPGPPAL
jgi:molybdopterin synthase catalytic subunit